EVARPRDRSRWTDRPSTFDITGAIRSFSWFRNLGLDPTAASLHPSHELLALLGRHLVPALHHPVSPVHPSARSAKATKQDPAEHQYPEGLPERDDAQS